jgi:CO/xanthine dehydrogenase Mo-binding subunit
LTLAVFAALKRDTSQSAARHELCGGGDRIAPSRQPGLPAMDRANAIARSGSAGPRAPRYLKDPRAIAVVKKVAEIAKWQTRPAPAATLTGSRTATGRGLAFSQYESQFTYVAVVAKVKVNRAAAAVRAPHVSVVHDCGRVVNPVGLRNQIEGNVI